MKKIILIAFSLFTLASITISVGVSLNSKEFNKTEASSYTVRSVPTTIDLNDASENIIRSYYSSLESLSASERQGTNLLKNLKPILKNNQKYLSYGTGATTAVWQAYEIVDRDWVKSPASSIEGYNSSTNIISGYTYGKSVNGNRGTNPYVHALYVNRDVENETTAWSDHSQSNYGINQEHVWAKARGFDDNNKGVGARGDLMHLWAGNGRVNGQYHSNYYYGYVDTNKSYSDAGDDYAYLSGNLKGFSRTKGGTTLVFEPQDSDKGDIARSIFYMVARYNYLSGNDSDGIDAGNPNLELVNNVTSWASAGYTSSTSNTGKMGILQDLLEWNRLDPPDEWEIHRNNILYNSFTNNRNPFIDFPEWAEYIWGKSEDGVYNSSSTGYAQPSLNVINGFSGGAVGTVESVTVSPSSLNLILNGDKSSSLTANVEVTNNVSSAVEWTTSNANVAIVNANGVVTATGFGSATITATSVFDGTKSGSCTVRVEKEYELYNGSITEGDYIIYYDGRAVNTTILSNRLQYELVTPSDNKINTDSKNLDDSIVWHIAKSGDYWTIYNVAAEKYLAGNGTKNQAQMLSDGTDDKALWTVSGTSTYEFINKYNSSDGVNVNAYLRNNGDYGFATYAKGTGGDLTLYRLSGTLVSTSITATVNKTYHVGETISKSDIVVRDNNDYIINSFEFANDGYLFTYADATSGGSLTNKIFAITYNDLETTLTVQVSRTNYLSPDTETFYIDRSDFDESTISTDRNNPSNGNVTIASMEFVVENAYIFKSEIGFGKNAGYVYNYEPFDTDIISFDFDIYAGCRTDGVKKISQNGTDWVNYSELECQNGGYRYFRIEYVGESNLYSNITNIDVVLVGEESAANVANYIMYEDTNNQCLTKLDVAIECFYNMPSPERVTFMTADNYVISTARTRFNAWLSNQGKQISLIDGDYKIVNKASAPILPIVEELNNDSMLIIGVLVISSFAVGLFIIKRKKSLKEI